MKFTYQVKAEDAIRLARRLEDGVKDFKEPLENAGIYMHKSIDKNFQSQGRPVKWQKHTPFTTKIRAKRGTSGNILMERGTLRQSVTSKTGGGSKYELSKDKLVIGSNIKARGSRRLLADIQQNGLPKGTMKVFGRPAPNASIPKRPFLMFQDEDEKMIERIFDDYIKGLL